MGHLGESWRSSHVWEAPLAPIFEHWLAAALNFTVHIPADSLLPILSRTRGASGASTHRRSFRFKPVSLALLLAFAAAAVHLGRYALLLELPQSQESMLPEDHMFRRGAELFTRVFVPRSSGQLATSLPGALLFGVRGIDRAGDNFFEIETERGRALLDPDFELSEPETQDALLRLVAHLRAEPCRLAVCEPQLLVMPSSCKLFLEAWAIDRGRVLPSGANFTVELSEWLRTEAAQPFREQIGFVGGVPRFVWIPFTSTCSGLRNSYSDWLDLHRLWETFLERELRDAPRPLRRGFPVIYEEMHNSRLDMRAITSAFAIGALYPRLFSALRINLLITITLCVILLACVSRSPRIALFATTTVCAVVGSLLGFLKLFGWTLGVREMCGIAVVVGFSFDYTLHLAFAFRDAPQGSCGARVAFAAGRMGHTLVGGALTTMGSIVFMFGSDFPFLLALAQMLTLCVLLSLTYALCFFLPLCAVAGPT